MSDTKFTPGRWAVDPPAMGFSAVRQKETGRLIFALACPSAQHGDDEMSTEEKHANLAALEAFPDLYAALESIQWGNAVWDQESGENGAEYNLCPMCDQSKVRGHAPDCHVGMALAKARGEA